VILIAAGTLSRLGTGALMPLLYSVLGDMFAPVEQSRWVGLMRISQGFLAMMMYYPIFLQGVKGISVMRSGQILTPLTVLMAFMSVPAGFILAKTI
jgi:hypothetical protein